MPWRNSWPGQRKGRSRDHDILRGLGMGLWRGDWVGSNYVVVYVRLAREGFCIMQGI